MVTGAICASDLDHARADKRTFPYQQASSSEDRTPMSNFNNYRMNNVFGLPVGAAYLNVQWIFSSKHHIHVNQVGINQHLINVKFIGLRA